MTLTDAFNACMITAKL